MSLEIKEEKVSIPGRVSIGASISYLDKAVVSPAVILIMGTGKTDRNGNQKGFHTDFYKNLAELFTSFGFVCIRYDKRGTYETQGNYNTAGLEDLIDDAVSVVGYAKALSFVDSQRIVVCGHSEGAMIVTLLSGREAIAGMILIGGAAMNMKDALLYQNSLLAEEAKTKRGILGWVLRKQTANDKGRKTVEALFQKCMNTEKDRIFFNGARMNGKWLREHGSYTSGDYAEILKSFAKPVLAITGKADLCADYKCLDVLGEAHHIQTLAPEGVNHMLRLIDDDNSMLTIQKQYKRLASRPIPSSVRENIEIWMQQFKEPFKNTL